MRKTVIALGMLVLLTSCLPTPQPTVVPLGWSSTPVARTPGVISPRNATQVKELARWGRGWVSEVAWSPDGRLLAVGTSLGIELFDAHTFQQLRFQEMLTPVWSLAFSPDGSLLASAAGRTISMWEVGMGLEMRVRWQGQTEWEIRVLGGEDGHSLTFSPDGTLLIAGSRAWEVTTGQEAAILGERGPFTVYSPDGTLLATASGGFQQPVQLIEAATGRTVRWLEGQKWPVTSVSFSPDGSLLASGSNSGSVSLWDVATGQKVRTLGVDTGASADRLAFSPDGKLLAAAGSPVRVWQVATGRESQLPGGYGGRGVVFSPDGANLAAGGGTAVSIWEVGTENVRLLTGYNSRMKNIALSPKGTFLAAVSDNTVQLWNMATGEAAQLPKARTDWPYEGAYGECDVAFSPDGTLLALAGGTWAYDSVRFWDLVAGQEVRALQGPVDRGGHALVLSVVFSPDGALVAGGSRGDVVRIWQTATGQEVRVLEGHGSNVESVAFSPDGTRLASGSPDYTIRLWDVQTGQSLWVAQEKPGTRVWGVDFSPDGTLLAYGSDDGSVKVLAVATAETVRVLKGHTDWVFSVAFSPDGTILASGGADGTVRLWEVTTGREVRVLQGHTGRVHSVVFSDDGTFVASASEDGTIRLWGVASP